MSMNMTAEKNAPAFDTSVTIAGVTLKNPVMTASGTFGSGAEYSEFVDLNKLGAVVTKGVANVPWPGNPTPRIAETHSGMLNAIGLQNPGIDLFCKRDIPYLKQFDTKIIVNVCGRSTEDYLEVVERLGNEPVDMLEINISCPNVKEGGIAFGQDPKAVEAITKAVKAKAKQPVIMKLSPNVTDITVMAKAADILEQLGISYEMTIISAHREPDVFFEYAKSAEEKGFKVIIAGAGMAAHLPGMCAAIFPMPVIGIPMHTTSLGGRDSLYSIVQMPTGIPVATVAINGGANAGILAAKILATSDAALLERLKDYTKNLKESVQKKDARLQEVGYKNY